MPGGLYKSRVSELRRTIAASRPAAGVEKVQVPGDGSLKRRTRALQADVVKLDDKVYAALRELSI